MEDGDLDARKEQTLEGGATLEAFKEQIEYYEEVYKEVSQLCCNPILWNELPFEIVSAPTLDTFKQLLVTACPPLFPTLP